MPVCDCGARIQSGQQCTDCALAERWSDVLQVEHDHDDLEECSECSSRIDVDPMDPCPDCGSYRRRPIEVAD